MPSQTEPREARADITVCVINFNYARYVEAAIDSALSQRDVEVEVVVVDDGSTDDSLDVIARYGDDVTLVLKENGGQASAMNAALGACTSDIILFLDADDELRPETCRHVIDACAHDIGGVAV